MAENAREPKASPANTGSTVSTAIQGAGDTLRTDDFYETVLAMASHDLRQPLQTIISAQELLARRLTTSPEREHLERSERASAQLAEQLDQLVDALHLHQSTGRTLLAPVALQPILGHLEQQLDGPARRKGVFGKPSIAERPGHQKATIKRLWPWARWRSPQTIRP